MVRTAIEVSQWFIDRGLDTPTNQLNGNVKLQKLLFFSWLIHCHTFGKSLFEDNFLAFTNGPVVENVRKTYKDEYNSLRRWDLPEYTDEEIESLTLASEIFGKASAEELVELSHHSPAWQKYYKQSIQCNDSGDEFKDKTLARIPFSELEEELVMIETVLYAHKYMSEEE